MNILLDARTNYFHRHTSMAEALKIRVFQQGTIQRILPKSQKREVQRHTYFFEQGMAGPENKNLWNKCSTVGL